MDFITVGVQLLKERFDLSLDPEQVAVILRKLLSSESGRLDVSALVSSLMADGGLDDVVGSWLGDGNNQALPVKRVFSLFGSGKVHDFAESLGLEEDVAAAGLADILPRMIDKVSSGGSLLDSMADVGSVMGFAKKLF